MNSLLIKKKTDITSRHEDLHLLKVKMDEDRATLNKKAVELYKLQLEILHISEIYRLAEIHFPRLRSQPKGTLMEKDIIEIDKWISRVKSEEGLKNIVAALRVLSKYHPHDIRSNLYGLVQKIIVEGPFKK
jgi:hypothetical protein